MKKSGPSLKKILLCAFLLLFVFVLSSGTARAQDSNSSPNINWWSCGTNLLSCALYGLTYAITTIMGLLVAFGAWLVQEALSFNQGIVNTPAVQKGFTVTLAVANLGFVVGIIVIAIGTILRSQSYGMKQMLWKLVVAAILVNFSLVIAGVLLQIADTFTTYFIKAATGGAGGFDQFVTNLTQGFAPQALFQNPTVNLGGDFGAILQNILNMVFIIILLFIIFFTFAALAVMLLIRYVYVGFLLILMPMAWLLWIFPSFSGNWTRWWRAFLRWAFFPPIVVFFLYLALFTAQTKSGANGGYLQLYANQSAAYAAAQNNVSGAIIQLTATGGNANGVLANAAQMLIVLGLALGGLVAANSLSITGASVAIGTMKSIGNAAQGYVGKQGKRAVSRAVPAKLKEHWEEGRGRLLPKRIQSWMGRGLGNVEKAGGGKLIDAEASWARDKAKNPEEGARLLAGSLNEQQRFALLKEMTDKGHIGKVNTVNGKSIDEFRANEKAFTNAGQEKLLSDLDKAIGHTATQSNAAKAIGEEKKKVKPQVDIIDKQIDSLKEKEGKINEAWKNASRAFINNPDAIITDTTGVVATAGTKMKAEEYVTLAQKRFGEVVGLKQKAEDMKVKITNEAAAKATIVDTKGVLGAPDATVNAKELMDKEADILVAKMSPNDANKVSGNDLYGTGPRFRLDAEAADTLGESFANALATRAPQFISPLIKKMKSEPLEKFTDIYMRMLTTMEKQAAGNEQLLRVIRQRRTNFEKSVSYNMIGGSEFEEGQSEAGGTTPPSSPPPSPPSGGKPNP